MHHSLLHKISRIFWFIFAALFLFEAWLWDRVGGFLRNLVALIPLVALKQALAKGLAVLPAPAALLVFLIPLAIIEPFKILGLWLITHHHLFLGIFAFVAAKVLGVGVVAFLFDVTRDKLLSMAWFARFYEWVLHIRRLAHDFFAPYKERIHAVLAPLKLRFAAIRASFAAQGKWGRKWELLRAHARRLRGLT